MSRYGFRPRALMLLMLTIVFVLSTSADGSGSRLLNSGEPTITEIHSAMESGELTCQELVQLYLDRIEAYDRKGPSLNSIVQVNKNALVEAIALDEKFLAGGFVGSLHCIPVIVKDNYDTVDMPTTAGSLSLAGSRPPNDAFQVSRIREAGAIVLAKSNMAEFAFSAYETLSSIVPGHTRNPYALDRVPAGSSGGTAAAVAASFGSVGLGTDTGNSIRGPSSHTSLVGIRSTMGLTSRDGIVPLNLSRDIGGPMARTVADAVAVFDVIVGFDPADPITIAAQERPRMNYMDYLKKDGLQGKRIGVVRELILDTADPDTIELFDEALDDMRRKGAVVIDPVDIRNFNVNQNRIRGCNYFKFDLNNYLKSVYGADQGLDLSSIIASRQFHPSIEKRLTDAEAIELAPPDNPACREVDARDAMLRTNVRAAIENNNVSVVVYPTWSNPPRLLGDLNSPHGNNSAKLSPPTGFPAITVPMGFTRGRFPAGIQLLGLPWSEGTLIEVAYAYEQATMHRRPPSSVPSLE